jgi:hypothetical protein
LDIAKLISQTFELLTGVLLFNLESTDQYTEEDDHFAQIIELFGRIPEDMLKAGKETNKYFDEKGIKHSKSFSDRRGAEAFRR